MAIARNSDVIGVRIAGESRIRFAGGDAGFNVFDRVILEIEDTYYPAIVVAEQGTVLHLVETEEPLGRIVGLLTNELGVRIEQSPTPTEAGNLGSVGPMFVEPRKRANAERFQFEVPQDRMRIGQKVRAKGGFGILLRIAPDNVAIRLEDGSELQLNPDDVEVANL